MVKPIPEIPQEIRNKATNEDKIVPIVLHCEVGDVNFAGLHSKNLVDVHEGANDIVAHKVNNKVDRFVIHNDNGEEFVIGWVYEPKHSDGIVVQLRDVVVNKYSHRQEYPDNPVDINEKYYAYDNEY